ncbi:hypothetical protein [Sphingobium sp. Ant17]|uniref:hypothetical protein n=1 Tax=Sphingobium sp. Ant17 TaxID=1461752 RepID=UPI0004B583DE|nr:hypothetical protein [Sphingobium sp. Ant17]
MAVVRKDRFKPSKPLSDKGTTIAFNVGAQVHAKRHGLTPGLKRLMAIYNAKVAN